MQILKPITDTITGKTEKDLHPVPKHLQGIYDRQIRYDVDYSQDNFILKYGVNDHGIARPGELVVITGHDKSRKSFLSTCIIASNYSNNLDYTLGFKLDLPKGKQVVVLDTERSSDEIQETDRLLFKMVNRGKPLKNYHSYEGKGEFPNVLVDFMEDCVKRLDVGLFVLDHIGDMVNDYNDEKSARFFVKTVEKIQRDHGCLFLVVVHTNRGKIETNGLIGSFIDKKAQSKFLVALDETAGDFPPSIAKNPRSRRKGIKGFKFSHNEFGYPEFLGEVDSNGFNI